MRIRVVCQNMKREITTDRADVNFASLRTYVASQAGLVKEDFIAQYIDEDGDNITLRDDEDVRCMLDWFEASGLDALDLTWKTMSAAPSQQLTLGNAAVTGAYAEPIEQIADGQSGVVILEQVGSGVSSVVHKAFDKRTKRYVALKLLHSDPSPDVQKLILSELNVLKSCASPEILQFHEAYFIDDRIALCTEFMDAGSLQVYIPIAEAIVTRLVAAMLNGLVYLWSRNILHRDIKPTNVLVNSAGAVKLCDFGYSTQMQNSIAKSFVGSNAYMSPERIAGNDYRISSEVWSLGITVFELITDDWPFAAKTSTVCDRPVEFLCSVLAMTSPTRPQFSPPLNDFLVRTLCRDPAQRISRSDLLEHTFVSKETREQLAQTIAKWIQKSLT